jgi:protein-disulfide isomerase
MNETIKTLLIPLSIMIAGAFIGLGLYFSGTTNAPTAATAPSAPTPAQPAAEEAGPQAALALNLDEDDHIYGNPDGEVFIVEYSDIDCPFCARVHPTLKSVVDNSDGEVAWVYRHFPIEQLHPEATEKAIATECVAKLAGNDAFWDYLDDLIAQQPIDVYTNYGVSAADFTACLEDPASAQLVTNDVNRAVESGGRGTPHSIVATREVGFAVSGAQPEAVWNQAVQALQDFSS